MNIFIPGASSMSGEVDALMLALMVVSAAVMVLVFGLMFINVTRYRASNPIHRGHGTQKSWRFEISWTAATLVVFFGLFLWAAHLYVRLFTAPKDVLTIYVTGKQWMWKAEHVGGQKEINTLHVPLDRDVQLVMTSEDVIHDFSVPAFRIKHDVLPGRYETLWFRPTQAGTYHLFCTQFCGLDHASMGGSVVVMPAPDYATWLREAGTDGALAERGRGLFRRYGCSGCHQAGGSGGGGTVRAPSLNGLYMSPVPLSDGTTVTADARYIRDSILMPQQQVVASYDPVMPSFAGQIGEGDLVAIVAYIQSLGPAP